MEWSRVVNSTTAQYIKGAEVNVLRNRKLLALLKEKGRISFNHYGEKMDWKVRYKQVPLQGYADGDTITFPRTDRLKTAQLDWRGYVTTDAMTKKERLMNKSVAQIVDLYTDLTQVLMKDIEEQFGEEPYVDGNAAGNEKRLHGIESFMANTGVSAGAPVAVPDDSYAGLDTDLQAYGGSWTGSWPSGKGDAHYDFWSPLLVDYTSAVAAGSGGWSSSTKTWPNTGLEAIRYGILYGHKNRSKDGRTDVFFLETDLYRQLLDALDDKERILVQRNGESSALIKLGFGDVTNIDGVDATTEFGIPATVGYGFNVMSMELRSMQAQLFMPEGPTYSESDRSWRYCIDFLGNLTFNPRNFVKMDNYS